MIYGYELILGIAIGQQDIVPTRDCCVKVSICWTGKEAQGYEQGTFPSTSNYRFLSTDLNNRSTPISLVDLLSR